jgi:hypothetical protein
MKHVFTNVCAGVILAVSLPGLAIAQQIEIQPGNEDSAPATVDLSFKLQGAAEISGFQFDIPYDPARHTPNLDSCLEGLPESHRGEFAVCNALPEKGMIRVVVMDLGRNRPLPTGQVLGTVQFEVVNTTEPAGAAGGSAPEIRNVLLAGPNGEPADVAIERVFSATIQ